MTRDVCLREVGLRDGLQSVSAFVATQDKLEWIRQEAAAGVAEIEVTSYVPPKLLPQFADAEQVTLGALQIPDLTVAALVPNTRGAERGLALGVHKINFVMSVSETHNMKNVRRSREESLADFRAMAQQVREQPVRPILCGGLATALGCSYEGRAPVDDVVRYAVALAEAGADELIVPDTVGYAHPALVRRVFKAVLAEVGTLPVAAHFHDTRGTGLANLLAALDCGVRAFDASLGGLGGCPFAPGATGNIVMEDAAYMLESMGIDTGIDLEALLGVRQRLQATLPDATLYGGLARAGLPRGFIPARKSLAA
ncbi:hydroxymethylglutaryl-CoA lyase [Bordetella holmesii]|uniref:HMGL-like protein n=2 Tax=Bordetella holmesii TaxID=35814 RepID=A0A158M6Z6_9BORD|nr:hydroxymethylglutaryl-CoA lyase [Bordetella holmesii]AIT25100.1 HMGL-like family protein [Bordetella holmesii 44057]EWM48487.1 HMGL-like family protein [Bordetella holmesii 41130]EWM49787.1 HMGL-like family protein [Bordetella holmesii 35009]AMD44343.1 3-hydroxy-3-methylglutaryl-CoA lyase [Bordetella holmesii H558]AOB36454.1 hydroxymethylglutaryl-CoA lyase [Bordetella holmesii]